MTIRSEATPVRRGQRGGQHLWGMARGSLAEPPPLLATRHGRCSLLDSSRNPLPTAVRLRARGRAGAEHARLLLHGKIPFPYSVREIIV